MSTIVVKPIDQFTFKDAQLNTPLFIGETVSENSKSSVNNIIPRSTFNFVGDEKTGVSKAFDIKDSKERKDQYFVRRIESPKQKDAFGPFLNKNIHEYQTNRIWVILGASNMNESTDSFKKYINNAKNAYNESSTLFKALKNDPNEIEKAEKAKEVEDEKVKQNLKKTEELPRRKSEADAERNKITETEWKGTVKTIEELVIDDVLKAESLFICEVYDSKKHGEGLEHFVVSTKSVEKNDGYTISDAYAYAYVSKEYTMIVRRSLLFDKEQINKEDSDKKDLFARIVLDPFYEYSPSENNNIEYNVFFVLDATDETSAKYAFLKYIDAFAFIKTNDGDPFKYQGQKVNIHEGGNVICMPVTRIDAWAYVYMSIKKSLLASPPPQFPEKEPEVKYLDELKPEDTNTAVSIFICQSKSDFSETIKKSFITKQEMYDDDIHNFEIYDKKSNISTPFVVRKYALSDKDSLEIYNKIQVDTKQPELTKESNDFFKKVALESIADGQCVVWFVLNAKDSKDAFEAIRKRFNFNPVKLSGRENKNSYGSDLSIYSKLFKASEARAYVLDPTRSEYSKKNPVVYVPVTAHPVNRQTPKPNTQDPKPNTQNTKPNTQNPLPFKFEKVVDPDEEWYNHQLGQITDGRRDALHNYTKTKKGGRHTTRKKSRKSIKRTKRSKSVKRHSRSKSRKSRSRK